MWNFLPAIIGAAGSMLSSSQQSQAIGDATEAQTNAANTQLQLYQDAQRNSQTILGKYSGSGDAARSRMMAFLRLPQTVGGSGQGLMYSTALGGAPDGSLPTPLSTANAGLPSLSQMITGGNDPSLWNAISNGNVSNEDWWATGGPSLGGQALASMIGIKGKGNGGSAADIWGTPEANATKDTDLDYLAYLQANPDVAAAYKGSSDRDNRYIGTAFDADGNGQISPEEYGKWHYSVHGKAEGRQIGKIGEAKPGQTTVGPAGSGATKTLDEAYEEAWNEYEQTPWGKLAVQEAGRARDDFTSMAGAQGSTLSGRTVRGMADAAEQAKLSNFNQYYTALGGVADQGYNADTGIASAGQTYANNASNVTAGVANAQAQGALAKGQASADGMADLASWIGWGFGQYDGAKPTTGSSYMPNPSASQGGNNTSGLSSRIR